MKSLKINSESSFLSGLEKFLAEVVESERESRTNLPSELFYLNEKYSSDFVLGYVLGSRFFMFVEFNESFSSVEEDDKEGFGLFPYEVEEILVEEFGEIGREIFSAYNANFEKAAKVARLGGKNNVKKLF